ncbi:hypothetical protein FPOA_03369 [Fusarium poae]|uniref:C2H2-type domain-containing protein n=1 Tax=Fusarium poae TaxID=36050 RepID=A0A1B8B9N7_FUSPO|nr:hypothetical protein FPOA_03369 [Fusarium poae]
MGFSSFQSDELFMQAPEPKGVFRKTFQTPFQPSPSDIFIAVMGMTGAGKSTFISHCTEEEVRISEPGALESCTQDVRVHKCTTFSPAANVYLVDTPGFDDTTRSDTDILKTIANWLTETYEQKIKLRGILYLHRISDNRMGGCANKNLIMFKRLCGTEGVQNVTFVTTHWEKCEQAEGEKRESALQSTHHFWGFFVDKGAKVRRHENNQDSALYILEQYIPSWAPQPPSEVNLAIQTEMVDSGKDLNSTSAGQELQDTFAKEREKMQREMKERELEMREASQARDKELLDMLREEQENQRAELRRRSREMDELKISLKSMHEERVQKLEARLKEQHQQHMAYRQNAERREQERLAEIELMQSKHDSERQRQQNMLSSLESQVKDLRRRSPQPQVSNGGYGRTTPSYRPTRQASDNFNRYRHSSDDTCLTCGRQFSTRDGLFSHLLALQHGRDTTTGKSEMLERNWIGDVVSTQ